MDSTWDFNVLTFMNIIDFIIYYPSWSIERTTIIMKAMINL